MYQDTSHKHYFQYLAVGCEFPCLLFVPFSAATPFIWNFQHGGASIIQSSIYTASIHFFFPLTAQLQLSISGIRKPTNSTYFPTTTHSNPQPNVATSAGMPVPFSACPPISQQPFLALGWQHNSVLNVLCQYPLSSTQKLASGCLLLWLLFQLFHNSLPFHSGFSVLEWQHHRIPDIHCQQLAFSHQQSSPIFVSAAPGF